MEYRQGLCYVENGLVITIVDSVCKRIFGIA